MLKKLTVHGFKSIERQTIEPGPLNVLIGANSSGKSNLLAALSKSAPERPPRVSKIYQFTDRGLEWAATVAGEILVE